MKEKYLKSGMYCPKCRHQVLTGLEVQKHKKAPEHCQKCDQLLINLNRIGQVSFTDIESKAEAVFWSSPTGHFL